MASGYPIDFTNQDSSRTFQLQPYTTNGPENPNSVTFDSKASSAATTLLLYGKGSPDYGERIQENLIHMLENFSSDEEPVYPIGGQLWYDRSVTPAQLRVYNPIKYQIVADTPAAANKFALVPPTTNEKAEMLAGFAGLVSGGKKIRIFQTTGVKEDYLLTVSSENTTTGNVVLTVAPTPSGVRTGGTWYVGGWEYVLQNNTPLHENLDAGSFKIINLADPSNAQDAATKSWVETEIFNAVSSSNELGELTDVTLSLPSTNEVLVFNGSVWTNSNILSTYLPLTGGTLTGNLSFGNAARVKDLLDPVDLKDAATKFYVDQEIASITTGGTIPANLDDLIDVSYSGPLVTNTLLNYNGSFWTNQSHSDFITLNDLAQTTGITMTGTLTLNGDPALALEAATKQYVDNTVSTEISTAISGLTDVFVTSGVYDFNTSEIVLTRSDSTSIGIFIPANDSTGQIDHTFEEVADASDFPIAPVGSVTDQIIRGSEYDSTPGSPSSPLYSTSLNNIITIHDLILGQMAVPKQSVVFTANGIGSTFYLGDSTGSPPPSDIAHTQADIGISYPAGFNVLNVYVDGQRQIVSERGFTKITGDSGDRLYPYMDTGLSDGTSYDFSVDVDGGGSTVVTITVGFGSPPTREIFRFNDLLDELNNAGSSLGFSVIMERGYLIFLSNTSGTGSSISVTNSGGGNPLLFSNLVGGSSTGTFTITGPFTNTNPFTPTSRNLTEETGQIGDIVDSFTLSPTPSNGAEIEVVVDYFADTETVKGT